MKELIRIAMFFVMFLFALESQAGFQAYQSTTNLGIYNIIKCSTGLSCTKVGDKLNITSSPSLVGPLTLQTGNIITNTVSGDVTFLSSTDTSITIKGEDNKAAILNLYSDRGDDNADKWSIYVSSDDSMAIRNNGTALHSYVASGDQNGGGTGAMYGYRNRVIPVSGTKNIVAADCGTTFISSAATSANLPEASTVIGCRFTFVLGAQASFDVNPADATDMIMQATNASGDAIQAGGNTGAALGKTIVLQAVSADMWVPIGSPQGTWQDIN